MKKRILVIILLAILVVSCFTFTGCEKASEGLRFESWDLGKTYRVVHIGSCTDTDIVIPSSYKGKPVKYIDSAFKNNTNIRSIKIPNSVEYISGYAFAGCTNLTRVEISNSVKNIGDYAFVDCTSLTSITIPKGVEDIGRYVFEGCENLSNIVFEDTSTWYITKSYNDAYYHGGGTSIDVTNSTQNVKYLKSSYDDYHWYKNN